MTHSIIQWNCRGLRANYNDLLVLLGSKQPSVCCLQELKIPLNYTFPNRQYSLHTSDHISNSHIDTGIIVNKSIANSKINLSVNFSAVACRVSLHKPITICSIYLPPSSRWDHTDLLSLLGQLPHLCCWWVISMPTVHCGAVQLLTLKVYTYRIFYLIAICA